MENMLNMSPEQMFAQVKTICSYCDTYEIYVNLILKTRWIHIEAIARKMDLGMW